MLHGRSWHALSCCCQSLFFVIFNLIEEECQDVKLKQSVKTSPP